MADSGAEAVIPFLTSLSSKLAVSATGDEVKGEDGSPPLVPRQFMVRDVIAWEAGRAPSPNQGRNLVAKSQGLEQEVAPGARPGRGPRTANCPRTCAGSA